MCSIFLKELPKYDKHSHFSNSFKFLKRTQIFKDKFGLPKENIFIKGTHRFIIEGAIISKSRERL